MGSFEKFTIRNFSLLGAKITRESLLEILRIVLFNFPKLKSFKALERKVQEVLFKGGTKFTPKETSNFIKNFLLMIEYDLYIGTALDLSVIHENDLSETELKFWDEASQVLFYPSKANRFMLLDYLKEKENRDVEPLIFIYFWNRWMKKSDKKFKKLEDKYELDIKGTKQKK